MRLLDTWESGLRPYLLSETDMLAHFRGVPGITDERLPRPAHDSGFDSILRDRMFQNLLLVRLRRLNIVMNSAEQLKDRILDLTRTIDQHVP